VVPGMGRSIFKIFCRHIINTPGIIISNHSCMTLYKEDQMDDVFIYLVSCVIMATIGMVAGYHMRTRYYHKRFLMVAKECETVQSIAPLIAELERES